MSEGRGDSADRLGHEDGLIEKMGIPRPLFWGFVGVLIFMIGDGIEISFVSKYLASPEGGSLAGAQASFATVTVYGAAVAVASYFSGTLSSIWGPRRVMWLGAAWWVVFQLLFLFVAIPTQSAFLIIATYGLRGFAYPLFAFGFLVWIQTTTREDMRGSAAGWFWFAFTGGLPTLGSAVAAVSLGIIGQFNTLVLSLVVVAIGGAIGSFAVREARGLRPIVDEDDPGAVENPTSYKRLFEGVSILKRDPRTVLGGVVRIVNTSPQYGFFALLPFTFGAAASQGGFMGAGQIATLTTLVYAANIGANLVFGIFGDRFGWRRTVTWFGCVGCAISVPAWYFVSMASQSFVLSVILGMTYGVLLAGFVPLSALMPSMVEPQDKGSALAVLNFGAGAAAFVGPGILFALNPVLGPGGVVITYAALYVVCAFLSTFIVDASDPGEAATHEAATSV